MTEEKSRNERRADPTITAIRENWALILVVIAAVISFTEIKSTQSDHGRDLRALNEAFGPEKRIAFTEWKVNITRDVQELKKACK